MIGTFLATLASTAATVAAGIAKTAAARKQQNSLQGQLDQRNADNDAWYNRRINEDYLERSEIKAATEQARRRLSQSSVAAAGSAAVMGLSNAVSAAQKEANNEAYTGLVANAAANASKEKDSVEDRYLTTKNNLANQQANVTKARYDAKQAALDTAAAGVQGVTNAYLAAHTPASSEADAASLSEKQIDAFKKTPNIGNDNNIGSEYTAMAENGKKSWGDLLFG